MNHWANSGILIRYFEPQQRTCTLRFGLPASDQVRQRLAQALERPD